MPADPVRDAALDVLLRVFERDVHLDISLDKTIQRKDPGDRGRRFMTQLAYGTVRHTLLCDHALRRICTQPLEKLPPPILAILRMGVFQSLFCDQVNHPSMVNTSVDLAKKRGHAGTARLVNAVLRRAPQSLDAVRLPDQTKDLAAFLSVRHSIPRWLVDRWIAEYGAAIAESLCVASSETAPVSLRVNTMRIAPEDLLEKLRASGLAVEKRTDVPEELTAADTGKLLRTQWFREGCFTFQDPASMLVAHLLEPTPGMRVLDLCAAPGGKTTHLAQLAGGQALVAALDVKRRGVAHIADNARRLGFASVYAIRGDAHHPPVRPGFDAVLLDAPCSGLGTLRRHPDLKYRLEPGTIARLAEGQRDLLRSATEWCRPGGVIVYSVCTFTPEETLDIARSAQAEGALELEEGPAWLKKWNIAKGQYRVLPSPNEALDGFFLMRFRKRS